VRIISEPSFLKSSCVSLTKKFCYIKPLVALTINRFVSAGQLQDQSYFTLDGSKNVILDWVKKAEDSSALIVRLYEAYGGRSFVTLKTPLAVKKVQYSNFLEDDTKQYLSIVDGSVDLTLNAFEVVTLKLEL
jgi:alpha-mannosidase